MDKIQAAAKLRAIVNRRFQAVRSSAFALPMTHEPARSGPIMAVPLSVAYGEMVEGVNEDIIDLLRELA